MGIIYNKKKQAMKKAPEMQFVFNLELNAKTKEDVIQTLKSIIFDLSEDNRLNIPCVISGSPFARYNMSLKHNAELTDEQHKKDLDAYLKSIEQDERNETK